MFVELKTPDEVLGSTISFVIGASSSMGPASGWPRGTINPESRWSSEMSRQSSVNASMMVCITWIPVARALARSRV